MSYFRATYRRTIIGAAAFHFRVRNGNGWGHCARVTRGRTPDFKGRVRPLAAGVFLQKNQRQFLTADLADSLTSTHRKLSRHIFGRAEFYLIFKSHSSLTSFPAARDGRFGCGGGEE